MNYPIIPYRIFPLGDAALTIDFGNVISEDINKEVIARFRQLQKLPLPGITEVVPAYCTLTVYYDLPTVKKMIPAFLTAFDWVSNKLEEKLQEPVVENIAEGRLYKIPVCYDKQFAPDIEYLAKTNHITVEELIRIHTGKEYRVYMLGFLPGFSYMGEVDEKISIQRKPQPVPVPAGSVGIAGRQTGIYPLASPGGWQIIGRTPVKLFDATKEGPVSLHAGDRVQFYSITTDEFKNY